MRRTTSVRRLWAASLNGSAQGARLIERGEPNIALLSGETPLMPRHTQGIAVVDRCSRKGRTRWRGARAQTA